MKTPLAMTIPLLMLTLFATSCGSSTTQTAGGSSSSTQSDTPGGNSVNTTPVVPPVEATWTGPVRTSSVQISQPCVPSGRGTDYQVGPAAGQLASLDLVPWESLAPGDTVRIFYRSTPYNGKFLIAAQGTADAPIRVCGVKGSAGERPIVSGQNATTRAALSTAYGDLLHQTRSIIVLKSLATQPWNAYPRYIKIDGLRITGAHPSYTFTDSGGVKRAYEGFGACVWIERGQHVAIADNQIDDCSQAIFSRSTDDGDFAVTRDLRIAGNVMANNGLADNYHNHTTYIQTVGVVYEFNRYGPMRAGATGNSIKDRSVGPIIRYNRIEDGARAIDLVEAEDYAKTAAADPAYRNSFVYGNQIIKDGRKGSTIHYGGDHLGSEPGANWGEPLFRKGTLYFFNNTVRLTGNGYGVLFQLSTTEERAEVWNNVFVFDASIPRPSMRSTSEDVGSAWKPGGILNLGRNWINSRWVDSPNGAPVGGFIIGTANLLTGSTSPVDPETLAPIANTLIDVGTAGPTGLSAYGVDAQLGSAGLPLVRSVNGAAIDLGAIER